MSCTSETEASAEEATEEGAPAAEKRRGRLLRDEHGYYVIDADRINELLDVKKYIDAWPQIPTEELHASSVQHPRHPKYRWLLNTRRVPVQASASGSAATEITEITSLKNEIGWGTSEINFIKQFHYFLGSGPLPHKLHYFGPGGNEIYGVRVLGTVGNETNGPHSDPIPNGG